MKMKLAAGLVFSSLFCALPAGAHGLHPHELYAQNATAPAPAAQPQPEQAQPAPAAAPAQPKADWMSYKNPYAGEENDLANPNRTPEEIASLAQQTATDVLSFGLADYKDKLNGFKKYFVAQGWQLYAAYLKDSGLLGKVTTDGYSVSAIVSSQPEIVSNGSTDGVYHWIVKLPLTINFFTAAADGSARTGSSGRYILFMDLARMADGGSSGIAINNWRVDPAPP